jgi:DNA-directed RNA polymerase specialized sigma24 family protein
MSEEGSAEFRPFPNTRWSLIDRAGGTGGTATREALESLLRRYLPAMLAHLVGRRKIDSHRAADLVQAFVSDKVIEHNLIARADQRRGKFRSFFLTALDRYAIDKIRQEQAQKRLPNQALLDESIEAIAIDATDSDPFDRAWAHEVIDRAVREMELECRAAGRVDLWEVFRCRILRPSLEGVEPIGYEELISRFGFGSPAQASNALITAKRMLARILRAIVGEYAENEAEVEEELAYLKSVLAGRA